MGDQARKLAPQRRSQRKPSPEPFQQADQFGFLVSRLARRAIPVFRVGEHEVVSCDETQHSHGMRLPSCRAARQGSRSMREPSATDPLPAAPVLAVEPVGALGLPAGAVDAMTPEGCPGPCGRQELVQASSPRAVRRQARVPRGLAARHPQQPRPLRLADHVAPDDELDTPAGPAVGALAVCGAD